MVASSSPSLAGSSARILRDASEMSELPTQKNSLKPAPVPSSPTKKLNSGLLAETSSATALEMGATVDEPWMSTLPSMLVGSPVDADDGEDVDGALVAPD